MSPLSPIALFTYNRLDHTRRTIDSLRMNELAPQSELFIFSDGARREEDAAKVAEVRSYLRSLKDGFRKVTVVERERNLGLARSIIGGVTEVVNEHGRVIVLEDDMITSPFFLRYMNEALDLYADDDRVISIHGYVYPVQGRLPETFLLRGADCWGWATWKRGWDLFETDGTRLLRELAEKGLKQAFDFNGTYPYTRMLEGQIAGSNDSWAIRWYASAFLHDRLTLYPGRSLVRNIGTDDSGTHCATTDLLDAELTSAPVEVAAIPVQEDAAARKEFENYFRTLRPGRLKRLWSGVLKRIGGV